MTPPTPSRGSSALFSALPVLFPLTLTSFLAILAIGIPLPVLPVRVHDGLGFGAVMVGAVVGSQSLVTVLTRGATGHLVDLRGARFAVLAGLPLAALAGVTYLASLAIAAPTLSLAVLVAGRMILGLAESLFITGILTWGIGRIGPAGTGLVMGWNGIAVSGALAVGAPVGVFMQQSFGFAGVALLSTLCPLAALLIALTVPGVARAPAGTAPRLPFRTVVGLIWRHGLVLALSTAPFALIGSFIVLAFAERGWPGAGLALTLYGGGFILVRVLFAHLPDRFGGAAVTLASLAVEGVGQMLIWSAPHVSVALVGAALTGAGFSLVFPAMGVEAVRRVPRESQGVAIGSFVAFLDIAQGLTGPLAGLMVARAGFSAVFLAGAAACAVAIAVALTLRGRPG
ncbi:MFS transporter [Azorhizobium doebereinerae]|uniref:MFS transporter n=1 Tax=Azorhizobium doebereinerae TaxID=281091 RepID=UPI000424B56F|nr:MFS transporter [Azorhizobium doebereinerae]